MKLLCDAIAFCYGPATSLKMILEVWKDYFSQITLIGTGTTREYISRTDLVSEIIPLDSEDPQALKSFDASKYDVYLCVCNPIGYLHLFKRIKKTVYVDMLLWMRPHGNPPEFKATQVIVERYPGYELVLQRFSSQIPRLALIPPLIKCRNARYPEPNSVVLNLGGQRSRMTNPGSNTNYPKLIVECLQTAVDRTGFDGDFVVTSDSCTAKDLASVVRRSRWSFLSLEHEVFLDKLATADCVITHPGLYSPFESICTGAPTFFLPSSNYSQILQLRNFRKIGLAPWSVDWEDLGCEVVPEGLGEVEGVQRVLQLIGKANSSSPIQAKLVETFSEWLVLRKSVVEKGAVVQQNAAAPYLGDYKAALIEVLRTLLKRLNNEPI